VKEIFIGSSKEGLEQATQVAAVLSEAGDVNLLEGDRKVVQIDSK